MSSLVTGKAIVSIAFLYNLRIRHPYGKYNTLCA